MDVLVRLEARPSDSPVVAHVNSIPVLPFGTRSRREVITPLRVSDWKHTPESCAIWAYGRTAVRSVIRRGGMERRVGWSRRILIYRC